MKLLRAIAVALCALTGLTAQAHDPGQAHYIANEGVMVEQGDVKILFDPIFDNGFEAFPLVAPDVKTRLMAGKAPYDGVDAVFVSHAHGDHFAAGEMIDYLSQNAAVHLIAPPQAVAAMQEHEAWGPQLAERIFAPELEQNSSQQYLFDLGHDNAGSTIAVTQLRVPHTGGERHEAIENMIYRVTLSPSATIMHLGDADADKAIFDEQAPLFDAVRTDMAFAPFWFAFGPGDAATREWLNADHIVGIHVPLEVPQGLVDSGADYFSRQGENRAISPEHDHD